MITLFDIIARQLLEPSLADQFVDYQQKSRFRYQRRVILEPRGPRVVVKEHLPTALEQSGFCSSHLELVGIRSALRLYALVVFVGAFASVIKHGVRCCVRKLQLQASSTILICIATRRLASSAGTMMLSMQGLSAGHANMSSSKTARLKAIIILGLSIFLTAIKSCRPRCCPDHRRLARLKIWVSTRHVRIDEKGKSDSEFRGGRGT